MRRLALVLGSVGLLVAGCGNRADDDGGSSAPPDESPDDTAADDGEDGGGGATDVGITADSITIGVVADLSGVVPGLFQSAVDAVESYAAMVNADGGINGRELVVNVYDTGTNDRGNGRAYETACPEVFASVGSESAFDTGGLEAIETCGMPMLNGFVTDDDVAALPIVFPRQSGRHALVGGARWFAEEFPEAVRNAAIFFVNAPVTISSAEELMEARRSVGWEFTYEQPVGQLESNYTPHAIEMRNRGVQAFAFVADVNNIVRLQTAMREQGVTVEVADVNTQGYTPDYLEAVGPAGEGSYVTLAHALFEEVDQLPAMQEYVDALEAHAPGEAPTSNGLSAWLRAKLFVEAATALGDDLTRESLMAELETIEDWDGDGLQPPDDIGEPVPEQGCFLVAQVRDGAYVRVFPESGFHCSPDDVYELTG